MIFFKNKKTIFFYFLIVGIAAVLASCKDDELVPPGDSQYLAYFPLEKGYWVEYQADSIVHLDTDDANNLDTAIRIYSFQIREVVDSSFIDAEGDLAWRINRYRRLDSSDSWGFMNVWTAKVSLSSAQKVEDNIRFIKLSFPLDPRSTWDGNAFNSFPLEEYSYENIHEPLSLSTLSFDSGLTVIQNQFLSGINRIDKREMYAKNVGMVYKIRDSLNIVNLPNGSTVILNGTEYKLEIQDYKR